jgi:hypothetical protein
MQAYFQFGFNRCQVLHIRKGGIQITLFPLAAGGLPLNNAFHVVHPVDQVAAGIFPNLPPHIIIIKTPVDHPGLSSFKADQSLFGLVDGTFDLYILAAEIRSVTADELVI